MKRFDVALEVIKQLITISSAGIFGVAAFTGSIFTNEDWWLVYLMIILVMLLLVVSICSGVLAMGAIANTIEVAEKEHSRSQNPSRVLVFSRSRFVSIFDNRLTALFTKIQQLTFLLAFVALFLAFSIDRTFSVAKVEDAKAELELSQDGPP
jgi:uncharacterized membrane protein